MRHVGPYHEKVRFGLPIFLFAVILLLAAAAQAQRGKKIDPDDDLSRSLVGRRND